VQPAQRLVPVHRGEGWQPVGVGPGKPQELAGFALTDNRKDASLQSGHLNDFAQVGLLRGALYAAAGAAGPAGLGREVLTGGAVVRALTLPQSEWAREPETKSSLLRGESERALREVVAYRLYVDLQRGWRITMPNLEQAGLLVIGYADLDAVDADEEWGRHRASPAPLSRSPRVDRLHRPGEG